MSAILASPSLNETASPTAQDQRRAQILSAARICFAEAGFHGASMHRICALAQMSPGALYRYFPSKDAIIEAIAEEEREQAGECIAALYGPGDLIDRLVAVAMDYLGATRDVHTGRLMIEIWSESMRNTSVGARFNEIDGQVRSAFRQALELARDTGEIDPGLDLDAALTMLFAIGDGLVMRLQLQPDIALPSIEPYLRRVISGLLLKT